MLAVHFRMTGTHKGLIMGIPPTVKPIDIEGMELSALQGMPNLLETLHPRLYLEMHGATENDKEQNAAAILDFLARRRYGLDALYLGLYRGFLLGFSRLIGWIDRYFVDGLLNLFSTWTLRGGDALRRIQTGQPQDYVYGVAFGVLLLLVWAQWWRTP